MSPESSNQNNSFSGFNVNFGENIKNFFSASFEWFTDMLTNVFSSFGLYNSHAQIDDHIENIELASNGNFSWINFISSQINDLVSNIYNYWEVFQGSDDPA